MNTNTKIALGIGGVALVGVLLRPKKAAALPPRPEVVPAPTGQDVPTLPLPVVQAPVAPPKPQSMVPGYAKQTDASPYTMKAIVKKGDTLSSLAKSQLAEEALWPAIFDLNRAVIGPNPDAVRVGLVLTMPNVAAMSAAQKAALRRRAAVHKQTWVEYQRTHKSGFPKLPAEVLTPTP